MEPPFPPFNSGRFSSHVRSLEVPQSVTAGRVRVIKLFGILLILKYAALNGNVANILLIFGFVNEKYNFNNKKGET